MNFTARKMIVSHRFVSSRFNSFSLPHWCAGVGSIIHADWQAALKHAVLWRRIAVVFTNVCNLYCSAHQLILLRTQNSVCRLAICIELCVYEYSDSKLRMIDGHLLYGDKSRVLIVKTCWVTLIVRGLVAECAGGISLTRTKVLS